MHGSHVGSRREEGNKRQGSQREGYCSGLDGSYISVPGEGEERAGENWQVPGSAGCSTNLISGGCGSQNDTHISAWGGNTAA